MWRFDKVAILFEDEFDFSVGDGAVMDKLLDGLGEVGFRKAVEGPDDICCLQTDTDGCV